MSYICMHSNSGLKSTFSLSLLRTSTIRCSVSHSSAAGVQARLHSFFSYVTNSTALPTRLIRSKGSLSRLALQNLVLFSMLSMASWPTSVLTVRISSNHCFIDAVTASLICTRKDGNDDERCWKKGVWEIEIGGILCMSSNDC